VEDMDSKHTAGVGLSLAGKVALITGGSRGIGAAAVRLFTQADAKVAFNFKMAHAEADALVAECGAANCVAFQHGLHSPADGRELVARTIAHFGRLDALVANHGVWPPNDAPIEAMADDQWRSTMEINLDSIFGLVQAAVQQFKQQGRGADGAAGHIVLLSSTAGQRGEANHSDYAATKGALISLGKSWSSELAPAGIYVNCVAPGWVDTDMSASALNHPETRAKIFGLQPLGRVASAVEIAGPILFLCSPYAGFISGEVLNVNGGSVLVG
jgi:3-oxoacyl-[acyl-carrier protein] reductase